MPPLLLPLDTKEKQSAPFGMIPECMYVCMCIYTYMFVYVHIYVHMYMYKHTHTTFLGFRDLVKDYNLT